MALTSFIINFFQKMEKNHDNPDTLRSLWNKYAEREREWLNPASIEWTSRSTNWKINSFSERWIVCVFFGFLFQLSDASLIVFNNKSLRSVKENNSTQCAHTAQLTSCVHTFQCCGWSKGISKLDKCWAAWLMVIVHCEGVGVHTRTHTG